MIAFILVFWYFRKNYVIFGKSYAVSEKKLLFSEKIMICPENFFMYVCEDNDMSGKVLLCPFEPLETGPLPPTFDASYAPEYIVNLSLQSVKTDLHRAHKRQDKSRLFHISDHDLCPYSKTSLTLTLNECRFNLSFS
jgi:hypothetical protein